MARTVELAEAFRKRKAPVVLVRITGAPPQGTRAEDWDVIVDELTGHDEDILVTKHTWGAFHATDLDLQLRRRGVTRIVLAGMATSCPDFWGEPPVRKNGRSSSRKWTTGA